jgi:hypothetical protein
MPTKKRYFTRNKEKVYHSKQDRTSIGNKSVNIRESVRLARPAQDKKKQKKADLSLRAKRGNLMPLQLPNIPQTITETHEKVKKYAQSGFTWQRAIVWVFLAVVTGISVWQVVLLFQKTTELQVVLAKRSILQEDLGLWQGIAQKYPTYRDAYFQASVLAYRLGDSEKQHILLEKTLQLDPNYLPAQNLEKISH